MLAKVKAFEIPYRMWTAQNQATWVSMPVHPTLTWNSVEMQAKDSEISSTHIFRRHIERVNVVNSWANYPTKPSKRNTEAKLTRPVLGGVPVIPVVWLGLCHPRHHLMVPAIKLRQPALLGCGTKSYKDGVETATATPALCR